MNRKDTALSSVEERVARGLTLTTWIVGIVWIVASVIQLVVWVLILWLGGTAVYPFFGWTLGVGATLVITLILLVLATRGIARSMARARPADDAAVQLAAPRKRQGRESAAEDLL